MDKADILIIDESRGIGPSGFVDTVAGEVGYGIGATKVAVQIEIGHDRQRRMEENPACFCKLMAIENGKSKGECEAVFYIKQDLNNRLANPWDAMTSASQENKFTKRTGRAAWRFVRVKRECFEFYLKFLDTRNTNYYRTAERLSKNG